MARIDLGQSESADFGNCLVGPVSKKSLVTVHISQTLHAFKHTPPSFKCVANFLTRILMLHVNKFG